jgi:peptidoglycan/LPS O-acetylase OafA/YrhL
LQYRSEIDGLRALAIIPVVFFHGGFSLVSGGFVGVDVFFVISGYLITLLIYRDLSEGSFSAKKFYERRIKRLFPALFFVAACCSVIAWFLYLPFDLENYYGNLVSVFNFSSNHHFYIHSGYFDPSGELNVLLHTWSLTVEEQFYFIFPWILLLTFKSGKKFVWLGVIALIIISFCLAEWRLQGKPMAAFYLLYARGWELLIGAFCALLVTDSQVLYKVSDTFKELLSWLGLAMILYATLFFTDATPAAGRYTLIPTIGTALIILFARTEGKLGQFLSNRLFVSIGLISYSTYLWHQPLLAFSRYYMGEDFDLVLSAILCAASFPIGYISWRFIEKPFRYGLFGWNTQRRVYSTAVLLGGSMLILGTYGESKEGFPERLDDSVRLIYQTPMKYEQVDTCFLLDAGKFDLPGCINKGPEKNVLIVGDSHAATLFPSLKTDLTDRGWHLTMLAYTNCVPFISNASMDKYKSNAGFIKKRVTSRCDNIRESLSAEVEKHDFDMVIILNHYNYWTGSYKGNVFPEFLDLYLDGIVDVFDKEKLLVLGSLPLWNEDLPKLIMNDYARGADFMGPSFYGLFDKDRKLDAYMADTLNERGIQFLSSMDAFCTEQGCLRTGASESGEILAMAYDDAHLSEVGSKVLSEYIVSFLNHYRPLQE